MKTTFDIKKLDCQSCAMVIEGMCEDVPGVQAAEVLIHKRQLIVEHDATVRPEQIVDSLATGGYPVEQRTE